MKREVENIVRLLEVDSTSQLGLNLEKQKRYLLDYLN